MLRSLYSGVSGMKSNQTKLDVIANNIANVSTTAFKSGRARFQDILSQTVGDASAPTAQGRGGINPRQVGLGVQVAGIDTMTNQGIPQPTGRPYDAAIDGDGYFIISDGTKLFYTRDGAFSPDPDFSIVTSDGYKLMGYAPIKSSSTPTTTVAGVENGTDPAATFDDVKLNSTITADTNVTINGVVLKFHTGEGTDARSEDTSDPPIVTYDYYGVTTVNDVLDRINGNKELGVTADLTNGSLNITANAGTGELKISDGDNLFEYLGATPVDVTRDYSELTNLSIPEINPEDPTGTDKISNFSIEADGAIKGIYESGSVVLLGEIALAKFANPAGLLEAGGNKYTISANSGTPNVGGASVEGRGDVLQSSLELSNVDLANEFTDMIITSRAYQANSRSITTSDEMLQELLNLKR